MLSSFFSIEDVIDFNFETMTGMPYNYFSIGAAVSEVEVDILTGDHTVSFMLILFLNEKFCYLLIIMCFIPSSNVLKCPI